MTQLQITTPTDNAKLHSYIPVIFTGKAEQGIVNVKLQADNQWDLGSDHVDVNGFWSINYSGFNQIGYRKITAIGFNHANQQQADTSINITISTTNEYTTTLYSGLVLNAKIPKHASKTPDLALSVDDGRKLFEEGILPILQSSNTFRQATAEGEQKLAQLVANGTDQYKIHKAPCAYSVSCVMKYIAQKLGFTQIINLFQNPSTLNCVQVTGVEIMLRRLGFNYFLKQDYLAPRGAIGARAPRNSNDVSGHIYFITKDGAKRTQFPNPGQGNDSPEIGTDGPKWMIKDLHAENLHFFDHVYIQWQNGYTNGFWLPPGIYPFKRS